MPERSKQQGRRLPSLRFSRPQSIRFSGSSGETVGVDGSGGTLPVPAVFVALDGIYAEGLVHVSDLGRDYFHFDAAKHQMVGERTHRRFRLGDRVRVKVARANLDSARIDFVLDEI